MWHMGFRLPPAPPNNKGDYMVVTPSNIQVYIMWNAVSMHMSQHHLTLDELDEAVALVKREIEENIVIVQPPYNQSDIRSGTPVEKETTCK